MNTFQIDVGLSTEDALLTRDEMWTEVFKCQHEIEKALAKLGKLTNVSSGASGGIRDFQLRLETSQDEDAVYDVLEYYTTVDAGDYYSVNQ